MDNSPLARIPAELRNDIYALVLTQPGHIHFPHQLRLPHYQTEHPFTATDEGWEIAPLCPNVTALVRTCKQIRKESTGIFYALNIFEFDLPSASLCYDEFEGYGSRAIGNPLLLNFYAFTTCIGAENWEAISSIIIKFDTIESEVVRKGVMADFVLCLLQKLRNIAEAHPHWHLQVLLPTNCLDEPFHPQRPATRPLEGRLNACKPLDGLHDLNVQLLQTLPRFIGSSSSEIYAQRTIVNTTENITSWINHIIHYDVHVALKELSEWAAESAVWNFAEPSSDSEDISDGEDDVGDSEERAEIARERYYSDYES